MRKKEAEIIRLVKKKDEAGLEMLFDLFYRPLVIYAQQFISHTGEAEDIVQDIFIRFWEQAKNGSIDTNIRAYLYHSVRNGCINKIKAGSRNILNTGLSEIPELSESQMFDEEEWNSYIEEIYAAVDALPPRMKEIFKSIVIENKKYKEVALELNISVNTVKTSFSRALSTLRIKLSREANIILTMII
ncbi:RNA polymerase sigma factor [Dysgonomonas sp. UBA7698]|uniref:RNA polymerase sigma factor n=1 Tax=Dysgonomonas sp. UBA7698 TaxID=1946427 RepID=UPI0025BB5855|nr:RNA polymerase sigma-70 factor [Dysgonomonas sp. UBA7698]